MASKTWFITGASSGLGRAFAEHALGRGHNVVATARRVDALADIAARAPERVLALALDVTRPEDARAAVDAAAARFHRIDVLINNAGYGIVGAFEETSDDALRAQMETNFFGAMNVIRAALPYLRKSKSPRIVNIASTEALGATALHSPYSAAKAGVTGLTRSLAVELGRDGITVNCICPGPIRTAITDRISEEHKTIYARRRTALGRYGDPEEVAHMTLSLCLPAASFLTGAVIPVDGGLMARNA